MLALTIRQPFVWEIFAGIKKREYRSWPTTHRGPLVIHAATSTTSLVKGWRDVVITDDGRTAGELLVFGAIVGVVDVTDCTWDKGKGCYAWHLARPRLFARPIPCKGQLKLWTLPPGIEG